MRAKLRDTNSYLAEWRRADPVPCGEDLEAEAAAAAARLEAEWPDERLDRPRGAGRAGLGGLDRATAPGDRPAGDMSGHPQHPGRLESVLRRRQFALTAETSPPDAAGAGPLLRAPPA